MKKATKHRTATKTAQRTAKIIMAYSMIVMTLVMLMPDMGLTVKAALTPLQNMRWIYWISYRMRTAMRAIWQCIAGRLTRRQKSCKFYYENNWQVAAIGTDDEVYEFYLTEGVHSITMEVALGSEMAEIIRRTDECISELNRAYRQLLIVIGSSPDTFRDYQLETKTPEALEILAEQYQNIVEIKEMVDEYSKGSSGSQSASIDNLVNQLEKMIAKPSTIAKQWSAFKDNIVSLG